MVYLCSATMATESDSSSVQSDFSSSAMSLEYESSSFESESAESDHEVHPFMYEPVLTSSSSGTSEAEDSGSDESISPRLLNSDW